MGRKKRKLAGGEEDTEATASLDQEAISQPNEEEAEETKKEAKPLASKYGLTAHSGEIVTEDMYVSDGSEDESEDVEVVLSGSRMGLMRRGGLVQPSVLIQPNRQWTRANAADDEVAAVDETEKERQREEELAKLDPAERTARLLIEKQRKEEEEKAAAREKESEENAGRDPTLFSKRTAFDIRFDQIEDKPWTRGGDISEFFNYGFVEEDWQEYAEHQLSIRQELIEAARQKRAPDPTVVPVTPRATILMNANKLSSTDTDQVKEEVQVSSEPAGPAMAPSTEDEKSVARPLVPKQEVKDIEVGAGGAWGAGAAPGTFLAKLIEDQVKNSDTKPVDSRGASGGHNDAAPQFDSSRRADRNDYGNNSRYGGHRQEDYGGGAGLRRNHDDPHIMAGGGGRGWQDRSFRGGRGFGGRGRGGWEGRGDARKRPRDDPRLRR